MERQLLSERVTAVRERIAGAAARAGRNPGDILLCAACKAQPSEKVREAAQADIDLFGENRAQEMRGNLLAGAYLDIPVHFIGHLQTNKVRQVVGQVAMIHSVDRDRLLNAIAREAASQGLVQDILLQVNLAGEQSKAGIAPKDLRPLLERAAGFETLRVRGLMAIPPLTDTEETARPYFAMLRTLFEQAISWQLTGQHWDTLSMGMSDSFEAAILEGATLVRVGRQIFGERAGLRYVETASSRIT